MKSDSKLKFTKRNIKYEDLIAKVGNIKSHSEAKKSKNPELIKFLNPLLNDQQLVNNLKNQSFDESLFLFAPKDKDTILQGIEILKKMKAKLEKAEKCRNKANFEDYCLFLDQAVQLNSEYLEVIPKNNPEMISCILNSYQCDTEVQFLKNIFEVSFQFRLTLGAIYNAKKLNPYDYVLNSTGLDLEVVDPHSEETDLILHYINSQRNQNLTLTNIVRVGGVKYTKEEDRKFLNSTVSGKPNK